MSEARAITNLIGNAVATMVIARWEGTLDLVHVRRLLDSDASAVVPSIAPVSPPAIASDGSPVHDHAPLG
jgi:aerobic C4-dicarboxylate transport protein